LLGFSQRIGPNGADPTGNNTPPVREEVPDLRPSVLARVLRSGVLFEINVSAVVSHFSKQEAWFEYHS
jgi:hypothetical protein